MPSKKTSRLASQINFEDTASLSEAADEIRKGIAVELARNWNKREQACYKNSYFDLYKDILPIPSGTRGLVFNNKVTEIALRDHALMQSNPEIVCYLSAKIIEQNYYRFYDPAQPEVPIENLAIAKHYGTFFTPPDISRLMIGGLRPTRGKNILLDPCAGSGMLLCAGLLTGRKVQHKKLVGVELDAQLVIWGRLVTNRIAQLTGYGGQIEILHGDGLNYLRGLHSQNAASEIDIIINPPYGRMRVTADRITNKETRFKKNIALNDIRLKKIRESLLVDAEQTRGSLSRVQNQKGIQNYSWAFFRACLECVDSGARVAIITPDAWMSGRESESLRGHAIKNAQIERIVLFAEGERKFSTVNQATSVTFLNHTPKSLISLESHSTAGVFLGEISYTDLMKNTNHNMTIPKTFGDDAHALQTLALLRKFETIEWLQNARGEADQTQLKNIFVKSDTGIPLVRGEHIERFSYNHSSSIKKPSFVNQRKFMAYISNKPKELHFNQPRLVGRQCSYALQKRRLIFSIVPAKQAIGNSCNYIVVNGDPQLRSDRMYLLLGLLNSAVLDWYFRINNSNNHVANYELDKLPFPINEVWLPGIASLARQIETAHINKSPIRAAWLQDILEAYTGLSYGLDPATELRHITKSIGGCDVERVVNIALHLKNGARVQVPTKEEGVFNNQTPTLSDLDRLIISHVPEGGNWQNIPTSVPSERLKQIRKMTAERGVVRTTYYGRLRREQPSYTINTYYNRPGNGTHIHPELDRTLTSREAARLQSFPDSYIFTGPEGAVRDQIGNAVPPLLAKAIGNKFNSVRGNGLCVDIFCGAGGLSLGLESSGWNVIAAVDNDEHALNTYALNRPSVFNPDKAYEGNKTAAYLRDLHDKKAFDDIVDRVNRQLGDKKLDLLVGGPPCQGFSHAGFRLRNDKRNDLASIYLHFAEQLSPRIFLLENVEGLLTAEKGKVLSDIVLTLTEMGYKVSEKVWLLNAEQYGVPQMRRRVFVVASKVTKIDMSPPKPTFRKCEGRREAQKQPSLFEQTLPVAPTVSEALAGLSMPKWGAQSDLLVWLESYVLKGDS